MRPRSVPSSGLACAAFGRAALLALVVAAGAVRADEPVVVALTPEMRGHPEEAPGAPIERRLRVAAFSDDGRRALVVERVGVGVIAEAVLVVDAEGVVLRLPLGRRVTDGLRGRARLHDDDVDVCTRSALVLAAAARDFQLASVRIGMCAHPDKPVLAALHEPRPSTLSAEVGRWHSRVGFAGPTWTDRHGPLVIVVGRDALGNDRLGTTTR